MIVESLSFSKDGKTFLKIDECLDLDPRSYFAGIESESRKFCNRTDRWMFLRKI